MFVFLSSLALIRLYCADIAGFLIFLLFSFFFLYSLFISYKMKKEESRKLSRLKLFNSLLLPKVTVKNEGYSLIYKLIVPSPELFNEIEQQKKQVK